MDQSSFDPPVLSSDQRRRYLTSGIPTLLLVIAALVTATAALKRQFVGSPPKPTTVARLANWPELVAIASGIPSGRRSSGPTIIEFGDYECDECASIENLVDSLATRFETDISVGFVHFPLTDIHDHAFEAAIAAECANEQGRFEAYHRALRVRGKGSLTTEALEQLAGRLGLVMPSFRGCLDNRTTRQVVERHVVAGRELAVRTTPTFYLDGFKVPAESLLRAVDSALNRRRR